MISYFLDINLTLRIYQKELEAFVTKVASLCLELWEMWIDWEIIRERGFNNFPCMNRFQR